MEHTEYYNKGLRYSIGLTGRDGRRFAVVEINIKANTSRLMDEWGHYKTASEAQKVLDDYAALAGWDKY